MPKKLPPPQAHTVLLLRPDRVRIQHHADGWALRLRHCTTLGHTWIHVANYATEGEALDMAARMTRPEQITISTGSVTLKRPTTPTEGN